MTRKDRFRQVARESVSKEVILKLGRPEEGALMNQSSQSQEEQGEELFKQQEPGVPLVLEA